MNDKVMWNAAMAKRSKAQIRSELNALKQQFETDQGNPFPSLITQIESVLDKKWTDQTKLWQVQAANVCMGSIAVLQYTLTNLNRLEFMRDAIALEPEIVVPQMAKFGVSLDDMTNGYSLLTNVHVLILVSVHALLEKAN